MHTCRGAPPFRGVMSVILLLFVLAVVLRALTCAEG